MTQTAAVAAPDEGEKMVMMSVCLPRTLRVRLERYASAHRWSASGAIRNLIQDNVPDNEPTCISGRGR